ncbi:holin [Parvimonas micra]|jgi:conserved domain protein|nr:MAG TPA: holin [Caudoviricetes sp.]
MKKKFDFKRWIKAAGMRAIKTMAQSAVALIGTATLITDVNIKAIISAMILSGVLSLLTSTAGLPELSEEE